MSKLANFRGSLLGLAIGDAMGMPIEFKPPGTFEPVTTFRAGGYFGLEAGYWTDDTSLALCLADSLIRNEGFDLLDQIRTYKRWWSEEAYMSSIDEAIGLGTTTKEAFRNFDRTNDPYSGPTYEQSAGNGSIMRLAPVPLFFSSNPEEAIEKSGESSKTTHGVEAAVDACRYMGGLLVGAVNGTSKEELLSQYYNPVSKHYWNENPLVMEITEIADGSFKEKEPPEIKGSGYVVRTLEAALWAFHTTDNFEDGLLKVVNLGDDADTTGAVYGQIAGAYYGEDKISREWREGIAHHDKISKMANQLFESRV